MNVSDFRQLFPNLGAPSQLLCTAEPGTRQERSKKLFGRIKFGNVRVRISEPGSNSRFLENFLHLQGSGIRAYHSCQGGVQLSLPLYP